MRLSINEPKTVLVCSGKFWNDTEIEIQNGDQYKFEATGKWRDLLFPADADGYTNFYMRLFDKHKRAKNDKWFALIGSVNKSDYFLIGKHKEMSFTETGNLYCFANDVPGFYWNNSGHLTLVVTRLK